MSTAVLTQVRQHFGSELGRLHLRSGGLPTSEFSDLLSVAQTEGKTVLLHFWNATSRSSLADLPHLRRWWQLYGDLGLTIMSIHTPEFDFHWHPDYLVQAATYLDIPWTVVNDLKKEIWESYLNEAWPRTILIAPTGEILSDHVGEGNYAATEHLVRRSLTHANRTMLPPLTESGEHIHRLGTLCYPTVPDHYLNAGRAPVTVVEPLVIPFGGTEVSAVLSSTGPSTLEVQLNGQPLSTELQGDDIRLDSGTTIVSIHEPRLYDLIDSRVYIGPAELSLIPQNALVNAYAVRFRGCLES